VATLGCVVMALVERVLLQEILVLPETLFKLVNRVELPLEVLVVIELQLDP
jgi:hypothetical protein